VLVFELGREFTPALEKPMIHVATPLLSLSVLALALPFGGDEDATQTSTLSLKQVNEKGWEAFVLPDQRWTTVNEGIRLHGVEQHFQVEQEGDLKIVVDTNGDGKTDKAVKGAGGELTLRGTNAEGERVTYPVRFRSKGSAWSYTCGGVSMGKLAGIQVRLIDQDGDGLFNEVGVDALCIGKSKAASFLSDVISLDDELYSLEVSEDGTQASITPWEGETGRIDLESEFDCRGKLLSAIVRDGQTSFNVAGNRGGLVVPAGEYEFVYGYAKKGDESVEIAGGRMAPLKVEAGKLRTMEWGGPIAAEVGYTRAEESVTVGNNLKYFGTGGEEYTRFLPEAKSPKILIKDADSGELLDSGRFAGC